MLNSYNTENDVSPANVNGRQDLLSVEENETHVHYPRQILTPRASKATKVKPQMLKLLEEIICSTLYEISVYDSVFRNEDQQLTNGTL